jgi:hypothetical protein
LPDLNLLRGQRSAAESAVRRRDVDCVTCIHGSRCDRGAELAAAVTGADAAVRDEMIARQRPNAAQAAMFGDDAG